MDQGPLIPTYLKECLIWKVNVEVAVAHMGKVTSACVYYLGEYRLSLSRNVK